MNNAGGCPKGDKQKNKKKMNEETKSVENYTNQQIKSPHLKSVSCYIFFFKKN